VVLLECNHAVNGTDMTMNPIARNILAAMAGFVVGSVVNLGLVTIGMSVLPLPAGTDVSTIEALRENMKLLGPVNFVFPLLAHALGTLTGAFVVAKLAASHQMKLAIGMGVTFLLGGIAMILNCGGPAWFIATDLLLAYIPMALLGGFLGGGKRSKAA
jgi:ABC-type uncharacterized transport system permease subunit